jgi:hypothetical protein
VLRPFAALNYGNADYAPIPVWDVSPPEDLETKARTLKAFGEGINQLRLGGVRVKSLRKFAAKFGLELGEVEPVDPIQVEAKLAGSTGKVESDAEQAKDESGSSKSSDEADELARERSVEDDEGPQKKRAAAPEPAFAQRHAAFLADVKEMRELGFEPNLVDLAARHGVPVPQARKG